MTKSDLIDEVAGNSPLSRKDAELAVQVVLDSMIGALKAGERIELRGFGSFKFRHRPARWGRNPKTGERVRASAKNLPYFKPSVQLQRLLNP